MGNIHTPKTIYKYSLVMEFKVKNNERCKYCGNVSYPLDVCEVCFESSQQSLDKVSKN